MAQKKFGDAIHAALTHAMETDPSVYVMGIGVDDHRAVFGSTKGLVDRFGPERVFDTPIAEGAMTGIAIGSALAGMKPVHIHIRTDFLYLAMDQLCNMAAKWRSMFGGVMNVPIVVRAVIGKSWGQGAQHSQALQSLFMHVPGLKVAMPTTAADAQDLLIAGIQDPNPVLLFEHRLLFDLQSEVDESFPVLPFKRTVVRRKGSDLTIVANSYMVVEALKAAEFLSAHGIEAEIVDPVTLVPLDDAPILASVKKTGRLMIVDTGWTTCGVSAEIAAVAAEKAFSSLKAPVRRLGMQPVACPVSKPLEKLFYADGDAIARAAFAMVGKPFPAAEPPVAVHAFKGPF
ncbi:MAG: alpha-ketoacid dehydrogenase subunit beta [Elusimicrobia bacterium]|nr:alpha-ketoacid dehydrogenase subunit beta [Elusimicrobiota bacterium]